MNIKSQKDFFSGLMFMCVGVAFAWGAFSYTIGNGARMGPGYFPLVLGILLSILGGVITFKSLVVETEDGDRVGTIAWKPLVFIIAANLLFGVAIGGLPKIDLPPVGLAIAILILVSVASMAEDNAPLTSIWVGGVVGLVVGAIIVSVLAPVFVAITSPSTYFSTDALNTKLFTVWWWASQIAGRLFAFFAFAFIFLRWVPLAKQLKEYALLTATLIAISAWAFIELIKMQIALWPAFFSF